jgi:hypothetical protein
VPPGSPTIEKQITKQRETKPESRTRTPSCSLNPGTSLTLQGNI